MDKFSFSPGHKKLSHFQIHDALEQDNEDIDSSGSGYGEGDDEDDIHTSRIDSRVNNNKDTPPNTHNSGHSGDGSDLIVDNDDDDYNENHEEKKLPIEAEDDNLYFDNSNNSNAISTSTDNTIASTATDDEDSQFIFLIIFLLKLTFIWVKEKFSFSLCYWNLHLACLFSKFLHKKKSNTKTKQETFNHQNEKFFTFKTEKPCFFFLSL